MHAPDQKPPEEAARNEPRHGDVSRVVNSGNRLVELEDESDIGIAGFGRRVKDKAAKSRTPEKKYRPQWACPKAPSRCSSVDLPDPRGPRMGQGIPLAYREIEVPNDHDFLTRALVGLGDVPQLVKRCLIHAARASAGSSRAA